MSPTTFLGSFLATVLTLAIFSRAFAANIAYRWAMHVALGMAAGYVAAIVFKQVLLPALDVTQYLSLAQFGIMAAAVILIGLLALRFSDNETVRAWGLLPLGVLAGVGGALALAGAVRGSLLPQLMATEQLTFLPRLPVLDFFSVLVAAITSLGVLLFLIPGKFEKDKPGWRFLGVWRLWGYWALMLALGALLASTAGARITLLIDRIQYLLGLWLR